MEAALLLQAIGSLGFPIAVAAWFMAREPRITGAINNNTKALNQLLVYLGGGDGKKPPGVL